MTFSRRQLLKSLGAGALTTAAFSDEVMARKGRIKQVIAAWPFQVGAGWTPSDLIRRIKKHHEFIGHVQIAGNPGRGEIGDDQEINYPGLMKALLKVDYQGYVGHEWIPTGEPLKGLQEALSICDV